MQVKNPQNLLLIIPILFFFSFFKSVDSHIPGFCRIDETSSRKIRTRCFVDEAETSRATVVNTWIDCSIDLMEKMKSSQVLMRFFLF